MGQSSTSASDKLSSSTMVGFGINFHLKPNQIFAYSEYIVKTICYKKKDIQDVERRRAIMVREGTRNCISFCTSIFINNLEI
jgi:hypothetical protein